MGLKYYQNSEEIIKSTLPVRAEYLSQQDLSILTYQYESPTVNTHSDRKIELHTYSISGTKLLSMYDVSDLSAPTYADPTAVSTTYIDVHHLLTDVGMLSGTYKLFFNFVQNLIGSADSNKLVISDISPSRREIRLKPESTPAGSSLSPTFIAQVPNLEEIGEYCILLNFGENNLLQAVNWAVEKNGIGQAESLLIKLYKPLPVSYDILAKCWVVGEVSLPYVDTVSLVGEAIGDLGGNIQGPNFEIDVDFQLNQGSNGFKTWNDLLGTGLQTSQQIVDNYFSGSLHGMKLNICYCEFDSFVHFSSAEERIKNFRYKLQLIEQYDSKLVELNSTVGSVGDNTVLTTKRRNEVVSGFDDFENYLYFQSGSLPYTFGSCSINPWPKEQTEKVDQYLTWVQASQQWNQQNSQWIVGGTGQVYYPPEKPYVLYPVNSPTAKTYYNSLIASASIFDRFNDHALVKAIPLHISEKDTNDEALTFVNMMGHHFDILWTYVNYLNQIIYRKENPADCEAMSCDMLYHVADSMGWKLTHGKLNSDLWEYTLGVSEAGTASATGSMGSKSAKEITCEVWRRTVNNLPHLLKTKGTSRSVKALLACYGIPQTMLSIKEYGGPKPSLEEKFPVFIKDTFKYALEFDGSAKYVTAPWVKAKINSYRTPDTIELRIRTRDSKKNYVTGRQTVLQASSSNPPFFVTLEKSGSSAQKGNAYFYLSGSGGYLTASIQDEYLFDGNWANIMVRRKPTLTYQTSSDNVTQDNTYSFYLKKHKYGKLTTNASASITVVGSTSPTYNQAWQNGSILYVGYGNNSDNTSYFSGSMQELRYWTSPLDEEDFDNHVTSPSAYDGNTITSSYDNLRFRIPMSQKQNLTTSASLMSQHPDQKILQFTSSIVASASFYNFVSSSDWNGFDEVYYIENPSLGGNNIWSEKVRLEDNELRGYLSLNRSVEVSSYDTAPVDSNKLGIYFSPQNSINEDIYNQLGFFEIDDYIGDPRDVFKSDYPELTNLAYKYWRKYSDRNDFNEYLQILYQYDLSFFKQLQQLMPARVDLMDGILIEPNVLERSKEALYQIPVVEDLDYYANLGRIEEPTLSGEYPNYEADIDRVIKGITGSFDQQNGEIDLKIYEPTIYCYSGSTLGWSTSGSYLAMAGPSPASQCEIFSPIISGSRLFCNARIVSGLSSSLATGTVKVFFLPGTQHHETDWTDAANANQVNPPLAINWWDISDIAVSGAFAENRFEGPDGTPTQLSRTLIASNYSYNIPSSAIITGIESRVFRKADRAYTWYNAENVLQSSSYEEMDQTIVIPGAHSESYVGASDIAIYIGKEASVISTDSSNAAEIVVYNPGVPFVPDISPVPFNVNNSITSSRGSGSMIIRKGYNESTTTITTTTMVSRSQANHFSEFGDFTAATGLDTSWSFHDSCSVGYGYKDGGLPHAWVKLDPLGSKCNFQLTTSAGNINALQGPTYAQFTPVPRPHFDNQTHNHFSLCQPLVVNELGFQIGSPTADPPYSDSGSWTIDGIRIAVRKGAYSNDDDSSFPAVDSEVFDSHRQDPYTSLLGGVFPFYSYDSNPPIHQAANWNLGDRQRYTTPWPRLTLTSPDSSIPGSPYTGYEISSISNFESSIYPTASAFQSNYTWGRTWTAAEINTGSFMVCVRPAYNYSFNLSAPNPYTCSAMIDSIRVDIFAHSASVSQSVLVPGHPEISGTVKNTWLTQSRWATFGGPGNLWNQTWTPAEVNDSGFSLQYKISLPKGTDGPGTGELDPNTNTGSIDRMQTKIYYKVTSSFPCSDIQEFLPEGQNDLKYKGSKMTSADWNIASPDTVDGSPVVSVHAANPNKFIVQPPGASGSVAILGPLTSGPPAPLSPGNV